MAEKNFNHLPDGVVPRTRRSPPRLQSLPRTPQDKCAVIRTLLRDQFSEDLKSFITVPNILYMILAWWPGDY